MSLYGNVELPGKPDLENVRKLDLLPVPLIRRMQRTGMAIDRDHFRELSSELAVEMAELEKDVAGHVPPAKLHEFAAAGGEWNVNSPEQVAKLLFDVLGIGMGEQLKRTASGRISTGRKQLEKIKGDHPVVQKIIDYRERAKLRNTYCDKLPGMARWHPAGDCWCGLRHLGETWRVHTEIATTRTETGRLASRKPNLSNVPQRTDLGARVRLGFISSPGYLLVSRDFNQIELRDLAHCSRDRFMLNIYAQGGDIHLATAIAAFGVPKDQIDKLKHRLPAKTVNFGICYGLTAEGLQAQLTFMGLPWDRDRCQGFIDSWYDLYPSVRDYMDLQRYRARRYGFVWDLFGRVRMVPEVRSIHSWIREAGLRQAGNMPIQALAAGQMKLTMGALEPWSNAHRDVHPLMTIHDQLLVEVPEDRAEAVSEELAPYFNDVMGGLCRVPITSDGEVMSRWVKN